MVPFRLKSTATAYLVLMKKLEKIYEKKSERGELKSLVISFQHTISDGKKLSLTIGNTHT